MLLEQFTEELRRSISIARDIAEQLKCDALEIDHLFLGIIQKNQSSAREILEKLWINVDEMKQHIYEGLKTDPQNEDLSNIPFADNAKQILTDSVRYIDSFHVKHVNVGVVLLHIFKDGSSESAKYLIERGITETDITELINKSITYDKNTTKHIKTESLDKYSIDFTSLAKDGKLDPILCRDREISRLVQILGRRRKNNPILIGDPGIGKTAIVEGLAQKIANNEIDFLKNHRLISLDVGLVIAGTKWRGQFEERLKKILADIKTDKNIIIFIDEIHMIIGAGSAEGSVDMANILKPALSRGEIKCIGATTSKEFKRFFEKDGALERRFQQIIIDPINVDDTIKILNVLKYRYEEFHGITFDSGVLNKIAILSDRYIQGRHLPDKAIDVMDEAAVLVKSHKTDDLKDKIKYLGNEIYEHNDDIEMIKDIREEMKNLRPSRNVTINDVLKVIYTTTGIPTHQMNENITNRIKNIENKLNSMIIGQTNAIKSISSTIRRSMTGVSDPGKPMGSFIFLGPSGVGKTELSKCLAECAFGDIDSIIRLDMSEYSEKHSIARLVGSPPGYVGYDEGGQLTERVRKKPYSVILVDELEKAHHQVVNIFLQILDEGRLTDGQGRTVFFNNTVIIMTSNIGSDLFTGKGSLGFIRTSDEYNKIKSTVLDELSTTLPTEFINRIDDVIVFNSLTIDNIKDIIELQINKLNERLKSKKLTVEIDESAINWLSINGYSKEYGVRYLDRCIKSHIEDLISDKLIDGDITYYNNLIISCEDSNLCIHILEEINN